MTVRFEVTCDSRTCTAHASHVVDDGAVPELQNFYAMLGRLGWTFTPSPRGQHVRGATLKVRCPTHKGSRR